MFGKHKIKKSSSKKDARSRQDLSDSEIREKLREGYDFGMLARTQPEGNIEEHSNYLQIGRAFVQFLDVYAYPKEQLGYFWLSPYVNHDNVIAFLSVSSQNGAEIVRDMNRSFNEKESRMYDQSISATDRAYAQLDIDRLHDLQSQIYSSKETIKRIILRLMVYDDSLEGLRKKVAQIKDEMHEFTVVPYNAEQKYDFRSIYLPESAQEKLPNRRKGALIQSYDLGGSYMYDYTTLRDPGGSYFGYTQTNGSFIFNPYRLTGNRTRAFSLVAGNAGMGKSSFLQRLNDDAFMRGDFICNFDVSGEYVKSTKLQNGLIIDTSSIQNRVNMFQIFPTVTTDDGTTIDKIGSFNQNLAKIETIAHIMQPGLTHNDLSILGEQLNEFYIQNRLWSRNPRKHLKDFKTFVKNAQYPTLTDFVLFLKNTKTQLDNAITRDEDRIKSMNVLIRTFDEMATNYGELFDGHTNIDDLSQEKVITFDMQKIKQSSGIGQTGSIFQAQFFSYMSLVISFAVQNGQRNRIGINEHRMFDDKEGFSLPYYYINIDEAEDYFNPKFPDVVNMLSNILEQMRKNYCAITFAFPTLANLLPSSSLTSKYEDYNNAVRKILGLIQYFHTFQLSAKDVDMLKSMLKNNDSVSTDQMDMINNLQPHQILTTILGEGSIRWTTEFTNEQLERYR